METTNSTDVSFQPGISKRLRSSLLAILRNGDVYSTAEIRRQMAIQSNLIYKRDYNINHFWGVINNMSKSGTIVRVGDGFRLSNSWLGQKPLFCAEQIPEYISSKASQENNSDSNIKISDVNAEETGANTEKSDSVKECSPISALYTSIVGKLERCYTEISDSLDECSFTAAQISSKDIQTLSEIAALKENFAAFISKVRK